MPFNEKAPTKLLSNTWQGYPVIPAILSVSLNSALAASGSEFPSSMRKNRSRHAETGIERVAGALGDSLNCRIGHLKSATPAKSPPPSS